MGEGGKGKEIPMERGLSGVARAFPGGQLAHLESQNEEENK